MVISCVRKDFHKMCFFIDHQHLDVGHTHSDAGHKHTIFNNLVYGRIRGHDDYADTHSTQSGQADIQKSHANIGNPTGARSDEETRPVGSCMDYEDLLRCKMRLFERLSNIVMMMRK